LYERARRDGGEGNKGRKRKGEGKVKDRNGRCTVERRWG